jgi:HK97 family phage prohead protease
MQQHDPSAWLAQQSPIINEREWLRCQRLEGINKLECMIRHQEHLDARKRIDARKVERRLKSVVTVVARILKDDPGFARDALGIIRKRVGCGCAECCGRKRGPYRVTKRLAQHVVKRYEDTDNVWRVDAVLSSESPDRVGDVVDPRGWSVHRENRGALPLLFDHSRQSLPLGRVVNFRAKGTKLIGTLEINKHTTAGREAKRLIDSGALVGVSIGFEPSRSSPRKGGGVHYHEYELLEISLTGVPANPEARVCVGAECD